jgi:hypothetical protein
MSRTHRRHEAPARSAKRGPKPVLTERPSVVRKTAKQRRPTERAKLRKEYR